MTTPSSNVGADGSREWQPIETAPKDDFSTFLVSEHIVQDIWNMAVASRVNGQVVDAWDHEPWGEEAEWTHWLPLPTPPAGETK